MSRSRWQVPSFRSPPKMSLISTKCGAVLRVCSPLTNYRQRGDGDGVGVNSNTNIHAASETIRNHLCLPLLGRHSFTALTGGQPMGLCGLEALINEVPVRSEESKLSLNPLQSPSFHSQSHGRTDRSGSAALLTGAKWLNLDGVSSGWKNKFIFFFFHDLIKTERPYCYSVVLRPGEFRPWGLQFSCQNCSSKSQTMIPVLIWTATIVKLPVHQWFIVFDFEHRKTIFDAPLILKKKQKIPLKFPAQFEECV